MQMPQMGAKGAQRIYSINEGYAKYWDKATAEYVQSKKFPEVSSFPTDEIWMVTVDSAVG